MSNIYSRSKLEELRIFAMFLLIYVLGWSPTRNFPSFLKRA